MSDSMGDLMEVREHMENIAAGIERHRQERSALIKGRTRARGEMRKLACEIVMSSQKILNLPLIQDERSRHTYSTQEFCDELDYIGQTLEKYYASNFYKHKLNWRFPLQRVNGIGTENYRLELYSYHSVEEHRRLLEGIGFRNIVLQPLRDALPNPWRAPTVTMTNIDD